MELIELKRACRLAWHAAEAETWPRIREQGLLSTSALLDLYGIVGAERLTLEGERRPKSYVISSPELGSAVIRDQRPLQVGPLEVALAGSGLTVGDWCRELNRRAFLWLSQKRLSVFLAAYGETRHDVLVIDARALADRHEQRITLSSINTGAAVRRPPARGLDTFKLISNYPSAANGGPAIPIVELAVDYSVPDIADITLRVERRQGPELVEVIWERARR
jgi:Family of unknown function (DUF7002)